MNPIIKFTTLFGLLAVELAVEMDRTHAATCALLRRSSSLVSLFFVYRSFYGMRIPVHETETRRAATAKA